MVNPAIHSPKRSKRMVALLALLAERGQLPLTTLSIELGASAATIRRDVAVLAAQGLLERTHGGVRARKDSSELPVHLRDPQNQAAKQLIAREVAHLIPAGKHSIGLTGGTTAAEVMRELTWRSDLTVITNSLAIGLEAAEHGLSRVLIVGGVLRASSLELVGSLAEQTLKLVAIDTAVVGADGLSVEAGLTTHDAVEARTNQALIDRAKRVIVACDSSKLGVAVQAQMAPLAAVDIVVTDSGISGAQLDQLRAAEVDVRVVSLPRPEV